MRAPNERPADKRSAGMSGDLSAGVADVIVAGHICLDLIPDMGRAGAAALQTPGALINVGGAVLSTGGAVANSGLALHRLGIPVKLMGKVGDDPFGRLILGALEGLGAGLADGMIVSSGEQSSYSIVISPRGADRIFLHCPGTNDTFCADDVPVSSLEGARLLHFGYPPLMKEMYADGGRELERLLAKAKAKGLTVSLDMSRPDPESPAGQVDWRALLKRVLPYVDLYLPSWEETAFMLGADVADHAAFGGQPAPVDANVLSDMAGSLLEMGPAIVGIKIGEEGLYVRTTDSAERLRQGGAALPASTSAAWRAREMIAPCFEANVAGTTGAGDCTIAGFLCGLLNGLPPEQTMTAAVAVGACSVETLDATSGIVPWPEVAGRIAAGWRRRASRLALGGWRQDDGGIWFGRNDKSRGNPL